MIREVSNNYWTSCELHIFIHMEFFSPPLFAVIPVTSMIETKGLPGCLRMSLFSYVPPYIHFSMHDIKGKFTKFFVFFSSSYLYQQFSCSLIFARISFSFSEAKWKFSLIASKWFDSLDYVMQVCLFFLCQVKVFQLKFSVTWSGSWVPSPHLSFAVHL